MALIAINVLLNPDPATVGKAVALNARLLEDFPGGFALDANHAPHITILQCFVPTEALGKVTHAVDGVLRSEPSMVWQSRATGLYALTDEHHGLLGIVIEPTEDLRRLQQKVIAALAPLTAEKGTAGAFAPRPDGQPVGQASVEYVNTFVGPRTGANYNPHLTVGIGTRAFVEALKAEPFAPFPFRAETLSLYQIGDYGVAQRKLHDFARP